MVKTNSFQFPSADGLHQIHASEWLPEGQPRAVVQIVHGLSDYTGRYDRFGRFLAEQGFLVCGGDHLGHGKTGKASRVFGWFAEQDGWDKVLTDVHTLHQMQAEAFPGIPYYFFGHSMGSFLTRQYLIRFPGSLSGAILSGTGQESEFTLRAGLRFTTRLMRKGKGRERHPLVLAFSLGAYNLAFFPTRTPVDWISRDPAVQDAYMADPLCRFTPTNSMFHDMVQAVRFIGNPDNLAAMDKSTPVFFLSGDKDPVGHRGKSVTKVYNLFRDAGCTDVTLTLYPDGRHEMLNELNYEQVHHDVLVWLESKMEKVEKDT